MKSDNVKADLTLLLVAAVWGFAFVAQRTAMAHLSPFWFTGTRFLMGGLLILPLALRELRRRQKQSDGTISLRTFRPAMLGGLCLFTAISAQQVGLLYTTAGKAGFITGLYVVFIPILGVVAGHRLRIQHVLGAVLAASGMYFLCMTGELVLAKGDALQLACAVIFAAHVLTVARVSRIRMPLCFAAFQFFLCGALSIVTALIFEPWQSQQFVAAAVPLFYASFISVGVGYTLQVVAQQHAHPAHAGIIMSLESVFAVIGGWMFLSETLAPRGLLGCGLMLSAMFVSQLMLRRSASLDN